MALLANGALPARGYTFETIDAAEMDRLVERAVTEPEATVFEAPMIRLVESPSRSTCHLVTRDGHFAHRSIIVRRLAATAAGRVVETIGFTVAAWIEQFRAEDAPIRRRTDQTIP